MAYIGAEPLPGQNREVDDISSSFNGSTTAFTLQVSSVNVSPESANNIIVSLGGVIQNPGTDYTIAASTITFTTAPASGLSFFGLLLGAGINTATVADQVITNAKVSNSAAIAGSKISPDFGSQTIATTGTVNTPSIGGGQIGNRNLVVNGAMNIAQRNGLSNALANGIHVVDRFSLSSIGVDGSPTQSQSDVAVGTTPYTLGFRKAFKATNGNQTSGAGAGDSMQMQTRLEAQDIATSGWNYTSSSSFVTLSFWVKSSVAQNFFGYILVSDGTSQRYPFETGSLTANTWTKVTKTIPGNSNLQFDNNNEVGMRIFWQMFQGTDFTDSGVTLNAWGAYGSGANRTPDNTSTWYTTNDATYELTGVQLEVGSVATDFEHRSFGDDLAQCQRYFVLFKGDVTAFRMGVGMSTGQTNGLLLIHLPITMRTKPTAILTTGTASDYQVHFTSVVDCSAVPTVHSQSTPTIARVDLTVPSSTFAGAGDNFFLFRAKTTDCFIGLESEV